MNTAANIDFAAYLTLKQSYLQPNINLKAITHHDLSKGNYTDTPPYKVLQLTPQLRFLNLSHNNIDKFSSRNLVEGAPLLEELNLSHNNIKTLDDIVELGGLLQLKKFSFVQNPITKTVIRVKIIEFLLNPSKYQPYEAVKILTATYNQVVNKTKLDKKAQEEAKTYKRMLERDLKEIDEKEFEPFKGNKYHQRGTPLKLATIECPVPRKTRFPMLKELNGQMISIQDIRQIFAVEDITGILGVKTKENEGEEGEEQAKEVKEKKEVFFDEYEDALKGINGKIYRRYLEGYRRRRKRRLETGYIPSTIKNVKKKKKKEEKWRIDDEEQEQTNEEEEEEEELKVFLEKDEHEKMKNKKSNFHFNSEEWRRPKDLDCKNAEFNIGISEFKELDRENNERKKKLAEKKKIKKMEYIKKVRREAAQKKKGKAGEAGKTNEKAFEEIDPDESWHSIGSDVELKKMFFHIKKKRKPKIDLDIQNNLTPVATSESSLAEREVDFGEAVAGPVNKMLDFENSKVSYEETEGGEENLSILRGRSGGMRPPLIESKEWKSQMKEFRDRLENLEYTSSPGTTPQGSPVRNLEPLEKSHFEKYSHPQINHPKKQIILRKMDTIEVVGQRGSESVRKISNKFLFENEPKSGEKAKKSHRIKLEAVQSSKGGPVKTEDNKGETDFKHSKEYLIAKQRTDEAKRISMYSPFKQGNKDVEWDNIIVKNELRAIEQLSAEKRRAKKRPTTFESSPDVPLPDDDIFNFVTQKKVLHPPAKSPKQKSPERTPTNNETISLKIPLQTPKVQSPNESMDYGAHHHMLYGAQTPLNMNAMFHQHRNFNRSGTNTSFNTEYIVALNPHHEDSSLPVTPFTGARSPKLHKWSSQHSREGSVLGSQPEIPDQATTPIMINERLLLKGDSPIEELKAPKQNKDNIHILTSFDQKPEQEANASTDRSSNDGAATGVLSDSKKAFASPHPIWSVRTSHMNLKSKLSIDIDANSKSKNTEINSTRTPNKSSFQPFSTLPSPANGTLALKSRPSSNYKKDPQSQHLHSNRGFKKSRIPFSFHSIIELVADLEKKKKPTHKTPQERLNVSHITTTETKPQQRPGTTASKFKPLASPTTSAAGSSGPGSRPGTSGGHGVFMRHASAPQVELVSKLKTSLVIDPASPVNYPAGKIAPFSPTSPGGMLRVFHSSGKFDSSRLSIAVPADSVLESARTQNSVVIDSKMIKAQAPPSRGKVKKITTPSGGRIISKNLSLVQAETPKGRDIIETGKGGQRVDEFLPTEKDGITKKMRVNILTGTDRKLYKKVLETMEKLEDFEKLIKESKELPGKLGLKGYEKKVELPSQEIKYEQMTEYLREFKGVYSLNYNDNVQLRKLIYPVNEHHTDGELRMGRLELEEKLRELSQKTLKTDGKGLVWLQEEIANLQDYLEIIQNLELAKEVVNNPRYIETLEKDEFYKAESHAVMAAHRLKLKKYYDEATLEKIFKGSIKIPEMDHRQNTTESSNRGPYLSVKKPTEEGEANNKEGKEGEKKEKVGYWEEIPKGKNVEKRSLVEEIREIKKIKDNAPGFPVVGSWNKKEGKEPCWKDGIERYIPEKMLTIEELMDLEKGKKYNEIYKKGRRFLSDEEKLIQELEKYKGDKKKKKDLRTRVEGYLKESGKVIDEFLENEYKENDKRHDKRHMFEELMKEVYNHGLSVGKISFWRECKMVFEQIFLYEMGV